MTLHFFTVPALQPDAMQIELNAFLSRERVLAVRREFITDGPNSCWVFCIEVAAGPGPLPGQLRADNSRANGLQPQRERVAAVDYKLVLSELDFAHFAALRELRKQLALIEGVPVYAVFSNEQLAAIVTGQIDSKTALGHIDGVGPARVEKYADAVLSCLQARRALQVTM